MSALQDHGRISFALVPRFLADFLSFVDKYVALQDINYICLTDGLLDDYLGLEDSLLMPQLRLMLGAATIKVRRKL